MNRMLHEWRQAVQYFLLQSETALEYFDLCKGTGST